MPWNYLNFEVTAGMSGYDCLWSEPAGAARCIIAGMIGIIVFLTAGILMKPEKRNYRRTRKGADRMEERMILILAVILCVVASTGAVYFGVRFCLMKKSVRSAASDLTEITGQLEENRVLKLEAADRDLEYLLCEMNRTLAAVRKERQNLNGGNRN